MVQNQENDKKRTVTNIQKSENKRETVFLQIPKEIKDKVEAYVDSLTNRNGERQKPGNDDISSLPSHGCFLVISLEKIEKIINSLNSCLELDTDDGGKAIKTEIEKLVTLLS